MTARTTRHKTAPNNARLIRIMRQRNLTEEMVATMASAEINTVRSWIQGQRRMPNHRMELFELRLDQRVSA